MVPGRVTSQEAGARAQDTIIIWFISVGRKIRRKSFWNTVHYPCGTKNVRRRHSTGPVWSCPERKEAESEDPGTGWNPGESVEKLRIKASTNSWIRGRPQESKWCARGSLRKSQKEAWSQAKKTGTADDYNGGETWRSGGLYVITACVCVLTKSCVGVSLIWHTKRT